MNVQAKVNIHNKFDIEVRDAVTGQLKQKAEAYNIVLDAMYSRLCAGNPYFAYIFFGTGTGTLSAARTSLFTHLGGKTVVNMTQIKAIPLSSWKQYIVLNPEDNAGAVLTEVGIAYGSPSNNLITHALLKDSEGNPISITKTALDVVTIYATVFVTFDTTVSYQGVAAGNNTLMNYLIGGAAWPSGSFGLKTDLNAKTGGLTPAVTWTNDTANKKRTSSVARFGINTGNIHAQAFEFQNVFAAKLPLAGVFTGQTYTDVTIGTGDGVTKKFLVPSLNIRQDTLAIKLDGVVSSALTKKIFKCLGNTQYKGTDVQITTYGEYQAAVSANGLRVALAGAGNPVSNLALISKQNASDVWSYDGQINCGLSGIFWVAMNAAGTRMVVTGSYRPFIRVYDLVAGAWVRASAVPTIANTCYYVCMSDDGNVIAMAYYDAGVRVFDFNGTAWVERTKAETSLGGDGQLALSANGLSVLYRKTATTLRMATWTGSAWTYRPDMTVANDNNGHCSISADCATVAAFANASPFIEVFDWSGSAWVKRANVPNAASIPTNASGVGVMSRDGLKVFKTGTPFAAIMIWHYEWYDGAWVQMIGQNTDTNLQVAGKISLAADDSVLAFSCTNGSAYWCTGNVFENTHEYTMIVFDAAPAAGVAITADYTVDGLHKTNQYVVDCSFSVKFGEN